MEATENQVATDPFPGVAMTLLYMAESAPAAQDADDAVSQIRAWLDTYKNTPRDQAIASGVALLVALRE